MADGKLKEKVYGKQKVYVANQVHIHKTVSAFCTIDYWYMVPAP